MNSTEGTLLAGGRDTRLAALGVIGVGPGRDETIEVRDLIK